MRCMPIELTFTGERWFLSVCYRNPTLYSGRTWVGCAAEQRPPYRIELLKGFSDVSVLAALRRKVDEIEGDRGDEEEGRGKKKSPGGQGPRADRPALCDKEGGHLISCDPPDKPA
jgi:hypothetical protein